MPISRSTGLLMSAEIEEFVRELVGSGLAAADEIKGCSEAEIRSLQAAVGLKLPQFYCDFMRRMGKRAGSLLLGTDFFWGRIRELRGFADEILIESQADFSLPKDAHVFLMHQGYVFEYFITDGVTDDPPVFQYIENQKHPQLVSDHLSTRLKSHLEAAKSMHQQLWDFRQKHGLDRRRST